MSRVRTFVAIDIDAAVRRQAKSLIQALAANTTGVKWVEPDKLHLTLKFLGEVEDKEIYSVCQTVQRAVAGLEPFRAFCQRVGAFPTADRPRTLWLGLDDPRGRLSELNQHVEAALAALGFPREVRQFRGHITIGRVQARHRRIDRLVDLIAQHANDEFGAVLIEECVIYASELTPEGPIYTAMGRASLGEG